MEKSNEIRYDTFGETMGRTNKINVEKRERLVCVDVRHRHSMKRRIMHIISKQKQNCVFYSYIRITLFAKK